MPWPWVLACAFLMAAILGAGARHYILVRRNLAATAYRNLAVVADLKATRLLTWRKERLNDAAYFAQHPYFADRVARWFADPDRTDLRDEIRYDLQSMQQRHAYPLIRLFDADGRVRLAFPAEASDALEHDQRAVQAGMAAGRPLLTDIHHGSDHTLIMELIAPLAAAPGRPMAGALCFHIDPERALYPTIRAWPASLESAETLLLRGRDGAVNFLSAPRHAPPGSAGRVNLDATAPDLVCAMAVRGARAELQGLDYRGQPVLAVARPIADTDWTLLVKVDAAEVYAPMRRMITGLLAVILTAVGAAVLVLALFNRTRQLREEARHLHQLRETDARRLVSEERWRDLFDNAIEGIFRTTPEGQYLLVNPAFAHMFGYASPEAMIYDVQDIGRQLYTRPEDREQIKALLTEHGRITEHEVQVRDRDGRPFWISINARALRRADGTVWCYDGFVADVTTRVEAEQKHKAAEAQLRQAQKLESIGTLASGIAHEINNPINGIMNYAQLIRDQLGGDPPDIDEFAGEIIHETERVAHIVRSLLRFARREQETFSPSRPYDIVSGTLTLLHAVMRHDQIVVEVEVADDLPPVRCRAQQVQQILMNLLTNARDALNEAAEGCDKRIVVQAEPIQWNGRPCIRFAVSDNGPGMPAHVRERIFDPFFTTKDRTRGTGLGLSIAHGIAEEHGGAIHCTTEPGHGTCFEVILPVHEPGPDETASGPASA